MDFYVRITLATMKSRKQFLFLILFILICNMQYSQTWQWAVAGQGNGGEGFGICEHNGNIYFTGGGSDMFFGACTFSPGGGGGVYLVKVNSSGNVLWAKGPGSDTTGGPIGSSVTTDANGNIYLVGAFNSQTVVFDSYTLTNSGGGLNPFLAKYNPSGNVIWARRAAGSTDDPYFNYSGNQVRVDGMDNVLTVGSFTSTNIIFGSYTLSSSGSYYTSYLSKYDSNGNVLWAASSSSGNVNAISVSSDAAGGIYVGGYLMSPTAVFGSFTLTNPGTYAPFLVKYDINGNVLWARTTNGSTYAGGLATHVDLSGDIYLGGFYGGTSVAFGTNTLVNPANGAFCGFLTKYNALGNVVWAKTCAWSPSGGSLVYSICSDVNSLYLSGECGNSVVIDSYTLNLSGNPPDPMFISKCDFNGLASNATIASSGGDDSNIICVDQNCNVYVSGDFIGPNFVLGTNTITSSGTENPFAAKLSFTCQLDGVREVTTRSSEQKIFPNPNTGSFNFQVENEIDNGQLILVNSFGQKVHEQKIIRGTNEIKNLSLPAGLYDCILFQNTQATRSDKIVIEK
jgi:hypothetical protein